MPRSPWHARAHPFDTPRSRVVWLAGVLCAACCWGATYSRADSTVSAGIYVRSDSDTTQVVTPSVRAEIEPSEDSHVAIRYALDAWTSASIDVRTSASQPITEQRHELNVNADQRWSALTIGGGYRLSYEPDYTSHGGSVFARYGLAKGATTLTLRADMTTDRVGQVDDASYSRGLQRYGSALEIVQLIDAATVLSAGYELGVLDGFQASAYRYVGLGGSGFGCSGALLCLPEHVPDLRIRHALAMQARRALSDVVSIGGGYRFYIDSWALAAHTFHASLAWLPHERWRLALRLRAHTQSAATLYQSRYPLEQALATYRTRDRELSTLVTWRAAVDAGHTIDLGDERALDVALSLAVSQYHYAAFIGLDVVNAYELSIVIGATL